MNKSTIEAGQPGQQPNSGQKVQDKQVNPSIANANVSSRFALDMSFLPDGVSGNWSVSTFEVPENDFSQIISMYKSGRGVPAGTYKRLKRNGTVVMSNTPDEIRDFSYFVRISHGSILINGLGLGCVVKKLLNKSEVTKITVIEKNEDVIKLVAPYFKDERLTVIHADAFEYNPPKDVVYGAVWHDIWDYITSENIPEMKKLHKKYAKKTNFQESWCKRECEKRLREEKRFEKYYF